MTLIGEGDTVVYEVALNEHPLVVGEGDDRPDEELISDVTGRTTIGGPLDWPEWTVFESDLPDADRLRYVNTATRINVKAVYGESIWGAHTRLRDVFDAIAEHVEIEGFNFGEAAGSHWGATHIEDFDGDVHLDVTDEERDPEN